jgi:HlyD family secretion protein
MKRKIIWILSVIVIVFVLISVLFLCKRHSDLNNRFQFAQITRGDLENTVSSTGTIEAVVTVEVGTQVSGIISKIYVDFNDRVRKGQILAVLDTIPLETQVLDAEARLEEDQTQLEQNQADYDRNLPLFEKGLLSQEEFLPFKYKLQMQQAVVKSSKAALTRAKQNLDYATIRSPINGTVIQRNIEVGQTVAASFNTPTLFIIAQDLSKMEIEALVDESDIGQIKVGQPARFTVEAYSDKTFEGTVRQVRLQPSTVQNVVNYTVIVDVQNKDNLLLPGMTTTIDFVVEQRHGVLLAPVAALKFQATPDMIKEFRKSRKNRFGNASDSTRGAGRFGAGPIGIAGGGRMNGSGPGAFAAGQPGSFTLPPDMGRLWILDDKGKPEMKFVKTGATDGKMTEIVHGRDVREGMKVIIGLAQKSKAKTPTPEGRGFRGPRLF